MLGKHKLRQCTLFPNVSVTKSSSKRILSSRKWQLIYNVDSSTCQVARNGIHDWQKPYFVILALFPVVGDVAGANVC